MEEIWNLINNFFYYIFLVAFYAAIFPNDKDAAFSNQRLWNSLAFAVAFGYSTFLCVDVKIYVLLGVLLSGVIGYIIIEIFEHKKIQ